MADKKESLKSCKLCGGKAMVISRHSYQLGYVFDSEKDGTMEYNFFNDGGILCTNCGLTLPFYDDNPKEIEHSIGEWNK